MNKTWSAKHMWDLQIWAFSFSIFQPTVMVHSEGRLFIPWGMEGKKVLVHSLQYRFDGFINQGVSRVDSQRLSWSKQFTAGWKSLAMWFYEIIPNHSARNPSSWPIDEMTRRKWGRKPATNIIARKRLGHTLFLNAVVSHISCFTLRSRG